MMTRLTWFTERDDIACAVKEIRKVRYLVKSVCVKYVVELILVVSQRDYPNPRLFGQHPWWSSGRLGKQPRRSSPSIAEKISSPSSEEIWPPPASHGELFPSISPTDLLLTYLGILYVSQGEKARLSVSISSEKNKR